MPRAGWASQTPNRDLGSLSPAIPQPKGWREDVGDARIWVASHGEDAVAISILLSLLDHTESPHGDSRVLNLLNPCESPFAHKDSSFQLWPFTRWVSLARGEQQFVSITLIFRVILWAVSPPPDPASIFLPSAHRGLTCVDTTSGLRGPWLPAGFGREPLREWSMTGEFSTPGWLCLVKVGRFSKDGCLPWLLSSKLWWLSCPWPSGPRGDLRDANISSKFPHCPKQLPLPRRLSLVPLGICFPQFILICVFWWRPWLTRLLLASLMFDIHLLYWHRGKGSLKVKIGPKNLSLPVKKDPQFMWGKQRNSSSPTSSTAAHTASNLKENTKPFAVRWKRVDKLMVQGWMQPAALFSWLTAFFFFFLAEGRVGS